MGKETPAVGHDTRKGTRPPARWQNAQHHWLVSDRAWAPVISEWLGGWWYSAGETRPISPDEMERRGWRWGAVARPPRRLSAP